MQSFQTPRKPVTQKVQKPKTVGNPILEKYRQRIQKQQAEQKLPSPKPPETKTPKPPPKMTKPLENVDNQVIDYNMLEHKEPLMLRYQRLLFQNFSKKLTEGPELEDFLK